MCYNTSVFCLPAVPLGESLSCVGLVLSASCIYTSIGTCGRSEGAFPNESYALSVIVGVGLVWTLDPSDRARKGLGNNLARKCLEHWNAAVGVDEGKNTFQPTCVRVLPMTGSEYTVERRNFENWSNT